MCPTGFYEPVADEGCFACSVIEVANECVASTGEACPCLTVSACQPTQDAECTDCSAGYEQPVGSSVCQRSQCRYDGESNVLVYKNDLSTECCGVPVPDASLCCFPGSNDPALGCFDVSSCNLEQCCAGADGACCQGSETSCCVSQDLTFDFSSALDSGCCAEAAAIGISFDDECGGEDDDDDEDDGDDSQEVPPIVSSDCIFREDGTVSSRDGPCCELFNGTYTSDLSACEAERDSVPDPDIVEANKDYDWKDPSYEIDTLLGGMIAMMVIFVLILIAAAAVLFWGWKKKRDSDAIDWDSMFAKTDKLSTNAPGQRSSDPSDPKTI